MSITIDLSPLHGDEPAAHHFFQFRQEGRDLFRFVHDLDDDRQIEGESQDVRIMKVRRSAVAHWSAQHRCTGKAEFSRFQDDYPVKWPMHIFVGFPKKYSQKRTLLR